MIRMMEELNEKFNKETASIIKDIETLKNNQSGIKNTITEVKNTLEVISSSLAVAEYCISSLENKVK